MTNNPQAGKTAEPRTFKYMRITDIAGAMRHNRKQADTMQEGKLYRIYDHYHQAFWGPDSKGYQYRDEAGQYTPPKAREVMLGNGAYEQERYMTVEEIQPEQQAREEAGERTVEVNNPVQELLLFAREELSNARVYSGIDPLCLEFQKGRIDTADYFLQKINEVANRK